MSVLHFGGFVIAVSPLQAFTRLHENWWSSQNSSFQPTNETNFLQKFPFFSIYFICGLIIGYSQICWYDIFRYMQDMRKPGLFFVFIAIYFDTGTLDRKINFFHKKFIIFVGTHCTLATATKPQSQWYGSRGWLRTVNPTQTHPNSRHIACFVRRQLCASNCEHSSVADGFEKPQVPKNLSPS